MQFRAAFAIIADDNPNERIVGRAPPAPGGRFYFVSKDADG